MVNIKEDFHVHTSYNDHSSPNLNIASAVEYADSIGLKTLAFTEHVRKESNWVDSYVNEIERNNITGIEFRPIHISYTEWYGTGKEREKIYGKI